MGVGARAASSAAMTAVIVSNGQSHGIGSDQQMSYNGRDAKFMFIVFLCVLSIVLVLAFVRIYVSYLICRRRRQQATTNLLPVSGQTPTTGLDPVAIAALPTSAYRRAGEAAPAECAVCLSAVEEGEMVRVLPNCRHVFHVGCIDMWLHSHSTCPLCRADAVAKEAGEASASPELFSGGAPLGPALDGTSGTKECGSSRCGGLGSSFRRMLSWELPGRTRRVQGDGVVDLERQQ